MFRPSGSPPALSLSGISRFRPARRKHHAALVGTRNDGALPDQIAGASAPSSDHCGLLARSTSRAWSASNFVVIPANFVSGSCSFVPLSSHSTLTGFPSRFTMSKTSLSVSDANRPSMRITIWVGTTFSSMFTVGTGLTAGAGTDTAGFAATGTGRFGMTAGAGRRAGWGRAGRRAAAFG